MMCRTLMRGKNCCQSSRIVLKLFYLPNSFRPSKLTPWVRLRDTYLSSPTLSVILNLRTITSAATRQAVDWKFTVDRFTVIFSFFSLASSSCGPASILLINLYWTTCLHSMMSFCLSGMASTPGPARCSRIHLPCSAVYLVKGLSHSTHHCLSVSM